MASEIGIALISTILEPMAAKAMTMVVNKVCGIVNMKRDISRLQNTLRMIQGIVEEAEEKQINNVYIQNWLRDLVDIAYEARDVLDDFITYSSITASKPVNFIFSLKLSCLCGSSSDTSNIPLRILNRLEKDIRSVNERFDEKIKKSETFTKLKSVVEKFDDTTKKGSDSRPTVGHFTNKQRDYLLLGRDKVKEEIMEKILHPTDDNDVHVVVIWGMGGIGKTTLAQSIYKDERVKEDDYPPKNRKWLCVGENKFSTEKVIMKIVDDKNTVDIENFQEKLVEKFKDNRFFIVLDDVWDVDDSEWNLLFNPLTHVGKGGLIIITKREKDTCPALINIKTEYNLEPLSEEDSRSIFESYAYVNGKADSTPDLKPIGEQIVKKLKGLPLALKVVGRSLLNKDSRTWTDFLESKFSEDDEVMSALRWSYNHLPRHLKMCFTYCALFPKDHVFDNENVLVEMWMAHDLIQKEEQKRPEDVGAQYFEQLVNASLLQSRDGGKYVMHDLIHDLALLVSNGEFATANSSLTNDQMKKVRHITITPRDYSKIPSLCKIEKLLTLYTTSADIYSYEKSVLDDVFKQLKSIRVLVLFNYGIKEIPDCISELKHLRYLDVSKTNVTRLPDSLCHLYNIQMLAASHAKLPRDIVKMVNLRYVRAILSTCKGVGKLTSLQELSSIHVCEGDNIRELGDMQRVRGTLTIKGLGNVMKLEGDVGALMEKQTLMDKLELEFDKQLEKSTISEEVLDSLGCPPNLAYLYIYGYTGVKPPSWMVTRKHKFDKLQTLKLFVCPKLESLQHLGEFDKLQMLLLCACPKLESLPPLGELTCLKHVYLQYVGVKRLGDEFYGKFTDGKVFFPSLESLHFSNMKEWEEWDDIIIKNSNVSFFSRLTRLEIKECAKLVSVLPTVSNASNFMKSLKDLDISSCKSLVQITSAISLATTIEILKISNCEQLQMMGFEELPSLKHLDVRGCNNLISIPRLVGIKFFSLHTCQSLRSLNINIHGLDSLERLNINDCPTLELVFEDGSSSSSSSGNSVVVPIHNITTDNTQVFRTLLHHEIVSLESLDITNLGGFENFDKTEANNFCKSRSLKILEISQCKDLMSLPPDFHKLSSLKSLSIKSCPQLQSLPPYFHKLSSLEILILTHCQQLQSLPRDFHKLSSLERLYIEDCPQLQSLPLDFHKLSSLKSLSIYDYPQLQSLPPDFHKLSSLEILILTHCQQLQSLPPDFHKLSSLERLDIEDCPQLQSLPLDFHKLSSLKSLSMYDCPQLRSLPSDFHKLSSLKTFNINDCPQLQSLPPYFHKLSSLKSLGIYDCPQLRSLPTDGFPPSLTHLFIVKCLLLYERCKDESGLDWNKIKDIPYKKITKRWV